MTDLKARLGRSAEAAFETLGLDAGYGRVTQSDRPELADFQCNGALSAAKALKRNPREIAAEIAGQLRLDPTIASVEIAGPGFVNIRVDGAALGLRANAMAADDRTGVARVNTPLRIIVDYAGPNVAKEMHVGHLRASIIGESIKRIGRFLGHEVLGDAHFGDWGFQMGLLIVACADADPGLGTSLDRLVERPADFDDAAEHAFNQTLGDTIGLADLDRLYPAASARAKTDEAFRDRARRATAELQAGRFGHRLVWAHFARITRAALERDFHALGVDFDLWRGESDVDPLVPDMIVDLEAKHLLVDDQGARIVRVAKNDDKRDVPPLLVVSSEGSAMYGTTDLATIVDRRAFFDPALVLYVVDQRQADHFETVFRAAYLAGYAEPGALEHVGFGTMNGVDGKPFKTREGGVLKLRDLIDMAEGKARERLLEADLGAELDLEVFDTTAHAVAVAALKFADLMNYRGTSYVFDLDRFSSFEGKTGPYLLYQAVRMKSVLRKADEQGLAPGEITIDAPAERDLALLLDAFDSAVHDGWNKRAPNIIAEHTYRLAQSFARFYAACPILGADDEPSKRGRIALTRLTLSQLEIALGLLGIGVAERM